MGEEQEEKRVVKKMKVGAEGKEGKATKVEGGGAGAAAAATGEKKAPGTPGERGKPKTKARFILFVGEFGFVFGLSVKRRATKGRKETRELELTFFLVWF